MVFCPWPVSAGPGTGISRPTSSDGPAFSYRPGPPGRATTGIKLRLFWPQGHRPLGRRADRRAVKFRRGFGDTVLGPGRHEGHRALGRQRVDPEVAVPPAGIAAAPALKQDQPPGIGVVIKKRVPGGGRGAAAIGIHHPQPQRIAGLPPAPPPPVLFQRIGGTWPGLVLVPQARVQGELKPVRVGADAADGHRDLLGAYQLTSAGTDPGITASDRIQGRRRSRTGSGGGGCGIESKKLMPSDWHRSRRPATMPLPQVTDSMAAAVLGRSPSPAVGRAPAINARSASWTGALS